MALSRPFQGRTIAGLPSTQLTQTKDQADIVALLDQLQEHLVLKLFNFFDPIDDTAKATDDDFTFNIIQNPSFLINDRLIVNAFDFLHEQRKSPTYQAIYKNIIAGNMPTPNEILYFSLVTDDVTLLTDEMVLSIKTIKTPHTQTFFRHINLLLYARRLATETNENERRLVIVSLEATLSARGTTDGRLVFCNLASIKLAGSQFHASTFQWLNLENANFSNCTFYNDTVFKDCLLNGATFQGATTTTIPTLYFLNCRLNKSNFSNTELAMHAKGCQLDHADFTQAKLHATFEGCSLKQATFSEVVIDKNTHFNDLCLLNACDFSTAQLKVTLNPNLMNDKLILFTATELTHPESLQKKLSALFPKGTFSAKELSLYRQKIVAILLHQLEKITDDSMKNIIISTARMHPIFGSQNVVKQTANYLSTGCGLFSSNQILKTTAEMMLENALLLINTPTPST